MRGKLRDKSAASRRDTFRRSENDVRRPYKRDQRNTNWIEQQTDEDEYTFDIDDELDVKNPEQIIEPILKAPIHQ